MDLNSKIYVAGHRGLVGSAILRELQAQGYNHIITRTHSELDLLDQAAVKQFFDDEQPEYVFLAAAFVGGIMANSTLRADFIYRNLGIQQNILVEAWKHSVKKLLFLGSTCIYPKESPQPIPEDALLTSPLEYTNEPYAIAKIAGLKMCESFNLQYGTNFLSVMPTNLYGYGDNFDLVNSHVLPAMLRKIHLARALHLGREDWVREDLKRRPIGSVHGEMEWSTIQECLQSMGITAQSLTLWGSGQALREFLWSQDMAQASVFVMQHCHFADLVQKEMGEIRNTHLNIGTGEEVSIRELADKIARHIGYTGEILWDRSHPDGTMRKCCDPRRIQQLGWKHTIDLDSGIARLYQWYRDDLQEQGSISR